jgi:protein phosphatase
MIKTKNDFPGQLQLMLKWTSASLSDQGVKRADNQDNCFISDDKRVFVVADGMGGAHGGSIASRLTVNSIESLWREAPADLDDEKKIDEWLEAAVNKANDTVFGFSEENPSVKGMGTTVVVGVQDNKGCIHIGHLGDSRAYLVRNGSYEVLTQDHSLVMELFRGGHITEEQMKESPFKHYITRCVGHKDRVELEQIPKQLQAGDWLLMCTDGLMAVLQDDQIAEVINGSETPEQACRTLVDQTLAGGAPDNVTVVVVKYEAAEVAAPAPAEKKPAMAESGAAKSDSSKSTKKKKPSTKSEKAAKEKKSE